MNRVTFNGSVAPELWKGVWIRRVQIKSASPVAVGFVTAWDGNRWSVRHAEHLAAMGIL